MRSFVLFLLCACLIPLAHAQDAQAPKLPPVALSDALVNRLPADYRREAKSLVTLTNTYQQRLLAKSDDDLAIAIVTQLGYKPAGTDFLVTELEKERSGKLREQIIRSLDGYWDAHHESQPILERHASSDPDAGAALAALSELRSVRLHELGKLLDSRLKIAKAQSDSEGVLKLATEQERHYGTPGEITLPDFLRIPPPLFAVKPKDQSIRVLSFGDFGFGNEAQRATATAMVEYHKTHPFDFGLTVGDNFYDYGMDNTHDPRWQTQFEQLYGPMHIQIYASFGNHDYGQPDSPAAEILYSQLSPDWRIPSPYYTYTAGPVQFFAIDTMNLGDAELLWLGDELAKSTARWKLVYGHFPIYSATAEDKELIAKLLPVLKKGHADIYLCGHHHNLQELKPDGDLHFFVSGGGGATLYDLKPNYDRALFKDKVNGFTVLEADPRHFTVRFIGIDGKELHSDTITRS